MSLTAASKFQKETENLGSLFAVASFPTGKVHGNKAHLLYP